MNNQTRPQPGFLVGMLLGAVLAAMFTPRSGDDMRRQPKDKYTSLKSSADKVKSDLKDTANQAEEDLMDETDNKL